MKQFLFGLLVITLAISSCAQNTSAGDKESNVITDPKTIRRILEEPIVPPENQEISLVPLDRVDYIGDPKIQYIGYAKNAFEFVKTTTLEEDPYPTFNFYFDNYEPIVMKNTSVPWELPEGDHIVASVLLDSLGHTVKYPNAYNSTMIRIKEGEIVKSADAGIMVYYNQPRKAYNLDEPVYLDFLVTYAPLEEIHSLMAIIDNKPFQVESDRTYLIQGLKPGVHMVELQLYRFGEIFNKPLNPSRMTFLIKE
jgi:hypothetical protein